MRAPSTGQEGRRRKSPAAQSPGLELDPLGCPRDDLEAFSWNVLPGLHADSVDTLADPFQSGVDLIDSLPGLGTKGQIEVTLYGQRVALARLTIELDVTWVAVLEERIRLGLEVVGTQDIPGPLGNECGLLLVQELLTERGLRLIRCRSLLRGCLLGGWLGRSLLRGCLLGVVAWAPSWRVAWPQPSSWAPYSQPFRP